MNHPPYPFKKVILSILLAAALTAICICCPNVGKGQSKHGKVKSVDTIQWDIKIGWLTASPNNSSIEMSLPDSTITIEGDTIAVIREMFNQFSDMSKRLRNEMELNEKYRQAWINYLNSLKNYQKIKKRNTIHSN